MSSSAAPDPLPRLVRSATPGDYVTAGEITVRAYRSAGFLEGDQRYAATLADAAARARAADLLIAVDEDGQVIGTATLTTSPDSPYAELAQPGDAELRMLAVDPAVQRGGVGTALVQAALARAAAAGCRRFVLSSRPEMATAHRIYERLGFRRLPELDWEPVPGFQLVAYARRLP